MSSYAGPAEVRTVRNSSPGHPDCLGFVSPPGRIPVRAIWRGDERAACRPVPCCRCARGRAGRDRTVPGWSSTPVAWSWSAMPRAACTGRERARGRVRFGTAAVAILPRSLFAPLPRLGQLELLLEDFPRRPGAGRRRRDRGCDPSRCVVPMAGVVVTHRPTPPLRNRGRIAGARLDRRAGRRRERLLTDYRSRRALAPAQVVVPEPQLGRGRRASTRRGATSWPRSPARARSLERWAPASILTTRALPPRQRRTCGRARRCGRLRRPDLRPPTGAGCGCCSAVASAGASRRVAGRLEVAGICIDIDARKRAEVEVHENESRLATALWAGRVLAAARAERCRDPQPAVVCDDRPFCASRRACRSPGAVVYPRTVPRRNG